MTRPVESGLVALLEDVLVEAAEIALGRCERAMPHLVVATGRDRAVGLDATCRGWEVRLRQAADGREQTRQEVELLDEYLDGAARRGVPLEVQLEVNQRLTTHLMHHYWSVAGAGLVDEMLYFSSVITPWFGATEQRFVDAYIRVHGIDEAVRSVRTAATAALLDGRVAPGGSGRIHLEPPPYLVVVVPGALPPGTAPPMHVVREGATVCVLPLHTGGRAQAERLSRASGRAVVAQVASSARAVPAAYAMARRLLVAHPAPAGSSGLVLPADAMPELLLTASGAAADDVREDLQAVLARLDRQPVLVDTLATYVQVDFDRRATAAALGVHRRTLHARLLRIADLTGHDPRTTRGIQVLALALAACRIAGTLRPLGAGPPVPGTGVAGGARPDRSGIVTASGAAT